ncbi:MAG: hypothetical protein ACM3Q2_14735 [Syntrophothermus sp.]
MKCFYLILFVCILFAGVNAQEMNAKQINQKITEIRRNTNWDDPASAKKANEQIRKLSKQLMMAKQNVKADAEDVDSQTKAENIEATAKVWDQIIEAADKGENADILFGKPVREEIIEEFIEDESPTIKNADYLNEMTLLVIDMSLKTVQRTIDQMDKFKSIKTLIITGGSSGALVNLDDLLKKAKDYPLEALYIINFRNYVTEIPKQINRYKGLTTLSLMNNHLKSLPAEVNTFAGLKNLYADINPIVTVLPQVTKLKKLENLGIARTGISQSEIDLISQQLPNCKILQQ